MENVFTKEFFNGRSWYLTLHQKPKCYLLKQSLSRDTLTLTYLSTKNIYIYIFYDDSLRPSYDDSHVSNVLILNLKGN